MMTILGCLVLFLVGYTVVHYIREKRNKAVVVTIKVGAITDKEK